MFRSAPIFRSTTTNSISSLSYHNEISSTKSDDSSIVPQLNVRRNNVLYGDLYVGSIHVDAEDAENLQWTLEHVVQIPRFVHMERSSIELHSITPEMVQMRLREFFRSNSIASRWDPQIARVVGVTPKLTKFVAQVWKKLRSTALSSSSSSSSQCNKTVLVLEIQRRHGSCIDFHQTCQVLFAIFTPGQARRPRRNGNLTSCRSTRWTVSEGIRNAYKETSQKNIVDSAPVEKKLVTTLESPASIIVGSKMSMLQQKCFESNRLVLEGLCVDTDATTDINNNNNNSENGMDHEEMLKVGRKIVLGQGSCGEALREWLVQCIQESIIEGSAVIANDDKYDDVGYEQVHRTEMHTLALRLLANSLKLMEAEIEREEIDMSYWLNRLLPCLLHDLSNPEENPHAAALASHCLCSLLKSIAHGDVRRRALAGRIVPALTHAVDYGSRRHLWLEAQSQQLMDSIGTSQ